MSRQVDKTQLPALFSAFTRLRTVFAIALMAQMIGFSLDSAFGQQPSAEPAFETMPIMDQYIPPSLEGIDQRNDRDTYKKVAAQRKQVDNLRRDTGGQIADALKGRGSVSNNQLDDWFNGYIFPVMTQSDDESLNKLGLNRNDLFRRYLNGTPPSALRTQLISGVIMPTSQKIVEGNFHPAARVNALIIIGRLNQVEGVRGTSGSLPQPYQPAFDYLMSTLNSADSPDYLTITALSGLARHASLGGKTSPNPMSDANRRSLIDQMISVLTADPKAEDVAEDVVYWKQRRAVQILGDLNDPGDSGKVAGALRDAISNENLNLWTRVDAVEAYSKLDFSDKSQASVRETVERIAKLLIEAANSEVDYIENKVNQIKTTAWFLDGVDIEKTGVATGGDSSLPGFGRGGNAEDPSSGGGAGAGGGTDEVIEVLPEYHREIVKRRIKAVAWAGLVALVGKDRRNPNLGLKGVVGTDDESNPDLKLINDLFKNIEEFNTATNIKAPDPDEEPDDDEADEDEEKLSLADQLKKALKDGAGKIQATLDKHAVNPAGGDTASGSASGTGQ